MRISDWSSDVCSADLRCADGDSAGHISGAIAILAAGIHQIERAHLNGAIGLFLRAVMDNCAIGAGSADGVEGQVDKAAGIFAQGLQPVRSRYFGKADAGGLHGKPVEQTGRSEEHKYELQSLIRNSDCDFCLQYKY